MPDQPSAAQQQAESIAALERGDLPLAAQQRIDQLRQTGAAWTTDLSVAELSAIRHAGFEPLGLVLGSSVFRIAAQWGYYNVYGSGGGGQVRTYPCPHGYGFYGGRGPEGHGYGFNWEHSFYEAGVMGARNAALTRIMQEARDLGAHGIVGVRLTRRHLEGVGSSMEFTVIGTAVRRAGAPPLANPFTSHLDGVSFGKLIHGGYVPVALVVGVGAVEIDVGCGTEWLLRSWNNQRIDQFSDGIEGARMLGISRLEQEIAQVDADGAVGVSIEFASHEVSAGASLVDLICIGTAVRRFTKDPLDEMPLPIMRLA